MALTPIPSLPTTHVAEYDADQLLLAQPKIIAPNGKVAALRDYTQGDIITMLRAVQAAQSLPQAQIPLRLVDELLKFCADAEIGREVIDAMPVSRLMEIIAWLQVADTETFIVSSKPDGNVKIAGKNHDVRIMTVAMLRNVAAIDENALLGDLALAVLRNDQMMVSMIDGMTMEQWQALPRRQAAGVERYLQSLLSEQAGPKAPSAMPAQVTR